MYTWLKEMEFQSLSIALRNTNATNINKIPRGVVLKEDKCFKALVFLRVGHLGVIVDAINITQ